ncbi:MAG TPA: NAD(P)-dependent oxidoreductase [Blastococcus sp.]|nr:NAD(P)-dependent oxidoreductase [Blastococcus sp.]
MTSAVKPAVNVVGVGAIGMPMARRLVHHGFDVTAVDPRAEARTSAEGWGMRAFPDVASAPVGDAVLVLVASGDQLLDTVRAATTGRRVERETWIVSSTVGPAALREAATVLERAGAGVIDAPVTGGVPGAENGRLRFLAAGNRLTVDSFLPLFSVLGTVSVVSEELGDGQAVKLVNQLCSSVHLAAAAEALAFAVRLGLDPVATATAIAGGSGSSWFLDERGPRMADLGTTPPALTRLAILAKDNELVVREAEARGAVVPLLRAASGQYARAKELGLLDADDSQIIRTYLA